MQRLGGSHIIIDIILYTCILKCVLETKYVNNADET